MKKRTTLLSLLFLNIFLFSCSNLINNSAQGSLSIVMPGSNGRYSHTDQTELPSTYSIKLKRSDDFTKEITATAGNVITIENLVPGNYDILLSGNTTYYLFEGKATARVVSDKDTNVNIKLVKFRKPLYVNSLATEPATGTKEHPFKTIREAVNFTDNSHNVAFYLDGTIEDIIIPSHIKKMYLRKTPGSSNPLFITKEIARIPNSLCDFTDILIQDTVISISGTAQLGLGGSTIFKKENFPAHIDLKNDNPIVISSPLTAPIVSEINLYKPTVGAPILVAENSSVNIAEEAERFNIQNSAPDFVNQYSINNEGKLRENKLLYIEIINTKQAYTCKIYEKGLSTPIISAFDTASDGTKTCVTNSDSKKYCFIPGKTYNVKLYNKDVPNKIEFEQDVTIKSTGENLVSFNLNCCYVSENGNDNNSGTSPNTALATINKALSLLANKPNAAINVIGNITAGSEIVNIPEGFTINGFSGATITNNITVTDKKLNLKDIKLTGKITVNGTGSLDLTGSTEAGNIVLNGDTSKINITDNLSATNAATIDVTKLADNRTILTGNITGNVSKIKLKQWATNDFTYKITSSGKLDAYDLNDVPTCLNKTGNVKLRVNISSQGDYSTLNTNLKSATATSINLVLKTTVTSIPASCFYGCNKLTEITLPQGLLSIGDGAFEETEITTLIIPNTVTTLNDALKTSKISTLTTPCNLMYSWLENLQGKETRVGNQKLTNVTVIPADTTTTISQSAFSNCTNITSLTLGAGITKIDTSAFSGCENISGNLVIPAEVVELCDYAFFECGSIDTITFNGNSLKYIRDRVFSRNSNKVNLLTVKNLPNSLESLGESAFFHAPLETIELPNNLKSIGTNAFQYTRLKSLVIPDSVTTLASYALNECSYLTDVQLPASLTKLDNGIFSRDSQLKIIKIPANVTSIVASAFVECANLKDIEFEDTTSEWTVTTYGTPPSLWKPNTSKDNATQLKKWAAESDKNKTDITLTKN